METVLLSILFLAMCVFWIWVAYKMIVPHWAELSDFFRNNPIGEWLFRAFVAIPIFGLLINIFDQGQRTVGGILGYLIWAVIAAFLYFR
jgi:hypothetical protein